MQAEKSGSDGTIARRERLLLGIAAAFVLITAVALALTGLRFSWGHLCMISLAYAAVFGGLHAFLNRHLPDRDPLLLPVAALLTGWGLVLIGRLALSFLLRQTGISDHIFDQDSYARHDCIMSFSGQRGS